MTSLDPDLAEMDGGPSHPESSLWAIIDKGVRQHPDHTAVVSMHQRSDHLASLVGPARAGATSPHLAWSYTQMHRGALRIASELRSRGVARGCVLVTIVANCAEWCLFSWVSAIMELTFVPLDPRMVEPARKDELRYHLEALRPDAVVVGSEAGVFAVNEFQEELGLEFKVAVCLTNKDKVHSYWTAMEEIATRGSSDVDNSILIATLDDSNRVATIIFTSGTSSGVPKGCPHTVSSLANSVYNKSSFWGLDADSRTILHYTNFRIIMTIMSLAHWHRGATVIMPAPTYSDATTLAAIEQCQATMMLCVPAMLYSMADDPTYSIQQVRSLRHVSIAGDVITTSVLCKAKAVFPASDVYNLHGMTEGCGTLSWPDDMEVDKMPSYQDVASVGRVMPGSKVRILADHGAVVKRGELGELHIGGLSVVKRYLGEVKPELFYEENGVSWLVTGDRALIDEDGWVYILGRSKDIIKRFGVPIAPAGLEAYLSQHTQSQVCVIGVPHPTLGQVPLAILGESRSNIDTVALEKLIVDRFGTEYALSEVLTLEELGLNTWPLNATGKIMKIELEASVLRYHENAYRP